jgi:hypothetical protein
LFSLGLGALHDLVFGRLEGKRHSAHLIQGERRVREAEEAVCKALAVEEG